ncbi:MAG TPA: ferritin-like domain-containing protein [Gammaproteobacteria bacterium]|nr:ferritin-like domain-containing protein [Gammaproteobacteria bacterium]
MTTTIAAPSREQLLHGLYEAAELEHNLMCTYLYAAFSLRDGEAEGLSAEEAAAVERWRRAIVGIAIEEMGHLTAVWNITSALGGSPRFGRGNFPLDPGQLPANVVVKLAPFGDAVLQHFIYLERPEGSSEPDGEGFTADFPFKRAVQNRLTPMGLDYETVGHFYGTLEERLRLFVEKHGEAGAFCGDPALQLSNAEIDLGGAKPVICAKTALSAFAAIVEQGEGAPLNTVGSHFQKFIAIRAELAKLRSANPELKPAWPAATNPVLRTPMRPSGRVWIENEDAAVAVDLANTGYMLMLRLIAYAYVVPRPAPEKSLAVDLALGLMRAVSKLAERAARLPAGPSNPHCNAGMSFTILRDAAPLPRGSAARRFFRERLAELAAAAARVRDADARTALAARLLADLAKRGERGFAAADAAATAPSPAAPSALAAPASAAPAPHGPVGAPATNRATGRPPAPIVVNGVEEIAGDKLTVLYEGKKCIHSRFCVTWGPNVFLANVQGPWIDPDAMDAERVAEIAHACPSGAIRYRRTDGRPEEAAPPVNLIAVREAGPYAVRADLLLDGERVGFRATLCRCGASKNKPFCDGSHHDVQFAATGEPATGDTAMLARRDGELAIDPEVDGPLRVRGNLEITSGTGRAVARVTQAKLCRCGGSNTKPFCDGTHGRIGFRAG